MTKAEQRAAILDFVKANGVTKLPPTRRGFVKTKVSSPERVRQVVNHGCPCCQEAVTRVKGQGNGDLSICNNGDCPARKVGSYYYISTRTERDPRQFF